MPEMKQGETSAAARFGEFEFDPRRGVLSRKGAVLKLQPQPFRVLELLLTRAPNIVTREELGAFIWGDEVHVDLEQSINYCVRQIRSVLDDSASNPRYIDTLPKQGYRFIAEVIREAAPVKAAEPTESSPPADPIAVDPAILMPASVADFPKLSRRRALWMGGAALLAGGGIWIGRSLSGRRREGAVNVVLPLPAGAAAADPGLVLGPPVVAPDGSAVIVSLKTAEGNYLFIRRLDTNRLIRMEGTLHGNQPFWSPDSQHVAFFADAKLKRMPIAGGSPVVLCEASVPRGGSWGSSGVLLFGLNFNGLFQVPEGGGTASAVTHLDLTAGENSHRNPVFLPDGDRFLYLARTDDVERRAIYMDSLKHSFARQRIGAVDGQFALGRDPDGDVYYLISQQAGKIVAQGFDVTRGAMSGTSRVLLDRTGSVSVSETGVLVIRTDQQLLTRILLLNRSGQQLGSVGDPSDYWSVALSPDGRSVLTDRHDSLSGQFKVWTASLSSGLLEPVSDSNHASFPLWSHNGDSMYFTDIRERTLLRRTVSPKGPEQKVMNLNDARRILVEDVSPDERYVVAEIAPDGAHSEICWSELNQTPQWHMVGATGPLGLHPRFSPDGRWLAVASNETGQSEIYVMDFPGGTRRQRISSDHGHTPRWRRDGKELFYIAGDGSVMSVDLGNGQDLQAATPKRLFHVNFRLSSNEPLYDVTGDGQRFLVIDGENKDSDSDIEMVLHWPSLLPR